MDSGAAAVKDSVVKFVKFAILLVVASPVVETNSGKSGRVDCSSSYSTGQVRARYAKYTT